jgi:hypothetical protein
MGASAAAAGLGAGSTTGSVDRAAPDREGNGEAPRGTFSPLGATGGKIRASAPHEASCALRSPGRNAREGDRVREPNDALRAARERTPSRFTPGETMTRAELADAVNAWLWENTGGRFELDDHLIGKWERGIVRYPIRPYRVALRAVLGVGTDAELGFCPPTRRVSVPAGTLPVHAEWARGTIVADASTAAEWDLINRRGALRAAATLAGAGLIGAVAPWLEPLAAEPLTARSGAFAAAEVEAVEQIVGVFRKWDRVGSGLGRTAVVGQLTDVSERLRDAPDGPLTDRMFLAAAKLGKIAASMAYDEGLHGVAQRHYLTAVRLAKAGGHTSYAAATIAALARQSFELGVADDGLEIVLMAQRATRQNATPALRSLLATREAWGHAQRGSVYAFERAVDTAEQAHLDTTPGNEPHWLRSLDDAELAGTVGGRYRELARHDRRHAGRAAEYLGRALALRHPARVRLRAFDLVSLARVHLLTGEPEQAAATVRTALPFVDPQRPGRLARRLADWRGEATAFMSNPSVRDSRDDIAAATTV